MGDRSNPEDTTGPVRKRVAYSSRYSVPDGQNPTGPLLEGKVRLENTIHEQDARVLLRGNRLPANYEVKGAAMQKIVMLKSCTDGPKHYSRGDIPTVSDKTAREFIHAKLAVAYEDKDVPLEPADNIESPGGGDKLKESVVPGDLIKEGADSDLPEPEPEEKQVSRRGRKKSS